MRIKVYRGMLISIGIVSVSCVEQPRMPNNISHMINSVPSSMPSLAQKDQVPNLGLSAAPSPLLQNELQPKDVALADADQTKARLVAQPHNISDALTEFTKFQVAVVDHATGELSIEKKINQESRQPALFRERDYKLRRVDATPSIDTTRGIMTFRIPLENGVYAFVGEEKPPSKDILFPAPEPATFSVLSPNRSVQDIAWDMEFVNVNGKVYSTRDLQKDRIVDPNRKRFLVSSVVGYQGEKKKNISWQAFFDYEKTKMLLGPDCEFEIALPDSSLDPDTNAEQYAEYSKLHTNVFEVIELAHSRGGLVARFYRARQFQRGVIIHVITTGTPSYGSPLAVDTIAKFLAHLTIMPGLFYTAQVIATQDMIGSLRGRYTSGEIMSSPLSIWSDGYRCLRLLYGIPNLSFEFTPFGYATTVTMSRTDAFGVVCDHSGVLRVKDEWGNRIGTIETFVDRAGNCYFNSAQALHAYEEFTSASAEQFLTVVAGRIPEKKKHDGARAFEIDILSRGMSAILTFGEKSEREKLAWTGALMDEVPITPGNIQEFTHNDGLVHRLSAFDRKSLHAPRPPYIQDEYLLDGLDHGELVSSERAFDVYIDSIRRAIERQKAKDTYTVTEWDKAKIRELVLSSIKFGNRPASGSRPTIEKSTRIDSIVATDAPNSARGILIQTIKTYRYKNGQLDDIDVDVRWYEAYYKRRGKEWEWAPGYTEVTP